METKKAKIKLLAVLAGIFAMLPVSVYAGDLQPSAPPGSTMKTLDEVEPRVPIHADDLPMTITEPNSYYLTEDVNFTDTLNDAITIECNDVTIDLMGYTLKGPDSGNKHGINIDGCRNIEIRNGTIRDFGYFGVVDLAGGNQFRVIGVRVISNGNTGMYLTGFGHLVQNCTAADNGDDGFYSSVGSTVSSNTCYANAGNGILTGNGCTVTRNTCYDNVDYGISTGTGCTITFNTTRLNDSDGIYTNGLGTISKNTADRNGGNGIYVNSGSVVIDNSCCENTGDGIYAGDGNRIAGNNCVGNGMSGNGAGIHTSSLRNVIVSNTVAQNDRGIDVDSSGNVIVKNTATSNTTEYDIAGGNKVGTMSTDPTTAGPWDNFDF